MKAYFVLIKIICLIAIFIFLFSNTSRAWRYDFTYNAKVLIHQSLSDSAIIVLKNGMKDLNKERVDLFTATELLNISEQLIKSKHIAGVENIDLLVDILLYIDNNSRSDIARSRVELYYMEDGKYYSEIPSAEFQRARADFQDAILSAHDLILEKSVNDFRLSIKERNLQALYDALPQKTKDSLELIQAQKIQGSLARIQKYNILSGKTKYKTQDDASTPLSEENKLYLQPVYLRDKFPPGLQNASKEDDLGEYFKSFERIQESRADMFIQESVKNKSNEFANVISGRMYSDFFYTTYFELLESGISASNHKLAKDLIFRSKDLVGSSLRAVNKFQTNNSYHSEEVNKSIEKIYEGTAKSITNTFSDKSANFIRDFIPQNTILIEYLRYSHIERQTSSFEARYIAIILTHDGVGESIVELGNAEEIDLIVSEYRLHFKSVNTTDDIDEELQENYDILAKRLRSAIWDPISQSVDLKQNVIVAPDGLLYLVSFAGLKTESNRYLVEDFNISYIVTGRDLGIPKAMVKNKGILLVGNPNFDNTSSNKTSTRGTKVDCESITDFTYNSLKGTQIEIDEIISSLGTNSKEEIVVLIKQEANEALFKKHAPKKRVIHIATHGYFQSFSCTQEIHDQRISTLPYDKPFEVNSENFGLFLAGANNCEFEDIFSSGNNCGILTGKEIESLDLRGTELVVLSACESGVGDVVSGEGISGLRRSLSFAGAASIISTLWRIPDKESAQLMGAIHSKSELSISQHVREVQLKEIERLRSQGLADHPLTWGAFIVIGGN